MRTQPRRTQPKVFPLAGLSAVALLVAAGCGNAGGDGFSRGAELAVSAEPNPVSFSKVNVGDEASQPVTITHVGDTGTVQLEEVTLESETDELRLDRAELSTALEPGESTTLVVVYAPEDAVKDSGLIRIATNVPGDDGSRTVEIPVNTLKPQGSLVAVPDPIDFGDVEAGSTESITVEFTNLGANTLTIPEIALDGATPDDFAIASKPETPLEANPQDRFDVEVTYTPQGGGDDSGWLNVRADDGEEEKQLQIAVKGTETSADLAAFPVPVDFGWKAPGETHEATLNLSNEGTRALEIESLELAPWSTGALSLKDVPELPMSIPPSSEASDGEGVRSVTVAFEPTADMEVTTAPIGAIIAESNDRVDDELSTGGTATMEVFGRPEAPSLQVTPSDLVDFGFVAQGAANEVARTVTLLNAGSAPLTVESISVTGEDNSDDGEPNEFRLKTGDGAWGPVASSPSSATLAPDESREIEVIFRNKGSASGEELAQLEIVSTDPATPTRTLDLKARRTDAAECDLKFVPDTRDFGVVARGFTRTMTVNLKNVGSGPCSFDSAFVNDCALPGPFSFGGFFDATCDDPHDTVQSGGDSEVYQIVSAPPAIQDGLKPGKSYAIDVMFEPPEEGSLFTTDFKDFAAFLGVRYRASPQGEVQIHPKPKGQNGEYVANLHAQTGVPNLTVFPQALDFAKTTIGCQSQAQKVNACNVGTAPLTLDNWELQGCSAEFELKDAPSVPKELEADACTTFELVYTPQDEGSDSCSLAVSTDKADTPVVAVPIEGEGTTETEQTDVFEQSAGRDVDVLFVVDNSGSMGDEQQNLSNNFNAFINEASKWDNDFQIAVTTTDTESDSGKFVGDPRWVTKENWEKFESNVKVGTTGSGTEPGMKAAQLALSLPNIADTGKSCSDDSGCEDPLSCIDGQCRGPNGGFLRENAALEVVFVSDEPDQSPAGLSFYKNFFKSIKGFNNDNLFHAHAIVAPASGGGTGGPNQCEATGGQRYRDLAQSTGGNTGSICDSSFSQQLTDIGETAFGLKKQFFLSRLADPGTLEVTVAGESCAQTSGGAENWSYDEDSNSVTFVENGSCMPQPGDEVTIHYDTLCLLD